MPFLEEVSLLLLVQQVSIFEDRLQFAQQVLVPERDTNVGHIRSGHVVTGHATPRVIRSQPMLFHLKKNSNYNDY